MEPETLVVKTHLSKSGERPVRARPMSASGPIATGSGRVRYAAEKRPASAAQRSEAMCRLRKCGRAYPTGCSEPRHLQWAFSRRSCAAFLYLYFGLQALLFVKRTSSSSALVGAAGLVPKGTAVAELTRRVSAGRITIERSIWFLRRMARDFVRSVACQRSDTAWSPCPDTNSSHPRQSPVRCAKPRRARPDRKQRA
jgi:hypothetical protein